MLSVLAVTGPIYLVIALGFAAGRLGVFSKADLRVLGKFVVNFALPALLFNALAQRDVAEVLNWGYLAAYAGGSLAVLLAAVAFARLSRRRDPAWSALYGMGMAFSNSGFVGYPIALQLLGPPAAVALALSLAIENVVLLPLALAMADSGRRGGRGYAALLLEPLRRLAANPLVLGIVAGFCVSLAGLRLPAPVARTIDLLAMTSTAVALFVVGGSLVGLKVRGIVADVASVAAGKLLLHPLAVGGALALLPPIDPSLRAAAVVFASAPMLSIYPILAQRYGQEGFCAAALLVATLASFVTINALLWLGGAALGWPAAGGG